MRKLLLTLFVTFLALVSLSISAQNLSIDGKIGIETIYPLFEVDIRTKEGNDGAELNVGNRNNNHFLRLFSGRDEEFTNPIIFWKDTDDLLFGSDLRGFVERMRITSDGDLGIATTTPNERLEVGGSGRAFFGDGGGDDRKGLLIDGIQGTSAARIESYDYKAAAGIDLVINTVGHGNVGIDVIAPSHILHIAGQGRSTSSTWATSSDRRVKQNIRGIDKALNILSAFNPVIFDWIGDYKKANPSLVDNKYGFIAQEVNEVLPQMVSKVKEQYGDQIIEDFNVLNTDALLPIMVKAIQEQQEIIEAQNHYIRNMDERLANLERREN